MNDFQPSRIARGNTLERRYRALVMLDRDYARGPKREQRACQPAWTGADFDDR